MAKARRQANETVDASLLLKRDKSDGMGLKVGMISTAGSAFAMGAGHLHFVRHIVPADCTITRMSILKAAQAVGILSTMGIYSDAGGPSTKLGQTNEHTNALANGFASQAGGHTFYDLQAPVTLTKGQVVWLAYIQNTTANIENGFNAPTLGCFVHFITTYSSTLPNSVTLGSLTSPSGGYSPMAGW